MGLKAWPEHFRRLGRGKKIIIGLAVILGLLIGFEIGLNLWFRAALERAFIGAAPRSATRASISWLGLSDILHGRVGWVRVRAGRCKIGALEYAMLHIDNRGFVVNMPALLKERRLMISSIRSTTVHAVIDSVALQEYLDIYYPQFKPHLTISPNSLRFDGVARVFGAPLPVRLEGDLRLNNPKRLEFFPTNLAIAGKPVAGNLLRFVSEQIPLQFGVLEDWPLQIVGFSLKKGYIAVDLQQDDLWGRNGLRPFARKYGTGKKVLGIAGENMILSGPIGRWGSPDEQTADFFVYL